jgi:hypothetical protein
MHPTHDRAGAVALPRPRFSASLRNPGLLSLALAGAGALALSGNAAAQTASPPRFHVSLSSTTTIGTTVFDDSALIAAGGGATPFPYFVEGHWLGTTGIVVGDVDAFARRPGAIPGSAGSMLFSTLSNEGGFLDGDILGLAMRGGIELVVSEVDLATALGTPTASIDVDALAFDAQGSILFSLADDLPATIFGTVLDGDVLVRQSQGTVAVVLTESDVQMRCTLATGSASAIGDVSGLEFSGGEIWVTVLSPSAFDGAVISCGNVPAIVCDEATMALGGAELDAVALAGPGDEIPTFTMLPGTAAPGGLLAIEAHGRPGTVLVALMSGFTGWVNFASRPGFGAWYFDPLDPWLNTVLGMSATYVRLDSQGIFRTSWNLPAGNVYGTGFGGEQGWSFQVVEVPTLELSAPYRVAKL